MLKQEGTLENRLNIIANDYKNKSITEYEMLEKLAKEWSKCFDNDVEYSNKKKKSWQKNKFYE